MEQVTLQQLCFDIAQEIEFDFVTLIELPFIVAYHVSSDGEEGAAIVLSQN